MQAGNRRKTGEVTKKHSVEKQALGPLRVWQTAEDGTGVLALQGNAEGFVKPLGNHAGRLASTASNESPQAAPGAHCHGPPPAAAGLSNQGEELNALISALLRGLQMGAFAVLICKTGLGSVRGGSRQDGPAHPAGYCEIQGRRPV